MMACFAETEFERISKRVQEMGEYDLELVLRVKNWKSQALIKHKRGQSWESVLGVINEAIKEAKGTDDVCAPFRQLCDIHGISVQTASALLAARYPDRFAIIDRKMFDFFRQEVAYDRIKGIFGLPDSDELRSILREAKAEFDATANSRWEDAYRRIYPKYLDVLRFVRDATLYEDLREVELKIWSGL